MKRYLFTLAILLHHGLIADRAHAQDVTLTVNQADLSVLAEGLNSVAYGKAAPLIQKLQAQVVKQQQPPQANDTAGVKTEPQK